jgi:hypothetical protein
MWCPKFGHRRTQTDQHGRRALVKVKVFLVRGNCEGVKIYNRLVSEESENVPGIIKVRPGRPATCQGRGLAKDGCSNSVGRVVQTRNTATRTNRTHRQAPRASYLDETVVLGLIGKTVN